MNPARNGYGTANSPPEFTVATSQEDHDRRIQRLNQNGKHLAYVALGSNLGDRVDWVEQACRIMEKSGKIEITRTSGLWETKAMYVENQGDFINGVCEVSGSLATIPKITMTSASLDLLCV